MTNDSIREERGLTDDPNKDLVELDGNVVSPQPLRRTLILDDDDYEDLDHKLIDERR